MDWEAATQAQPIQQLEVEAAPADRLAAPADRLAEQAQEGQRVALVMAEQPELVEQVEQVEQAEPGLQVALLPVQQLVLVRLQQIQELLPQ